MPLSRPEIAMLESSGDMLSQERQYQFLFCFVDVVKGVEAIPRTMPGPGRKAYISNRILGIFIYWSKSNDN